MNIFLMGIIGLLACGDKETDTSSDTTDTNDVVDTGGDTDTGEETVVDADNDGVPSEDDCDDNDPNSTIVAEDADCDGAITADDCDDADAAIGGTTDLEGDGFYLSENCVTVVCPDVEAGATGMVNGVTYTKRERAGLDTLIAADDWTAIERTCVSGVADMEYLFTDQTTIPWVPKELSVDLSSWDVSSVTNMKGVFYIAIFIQEAGIGLWDTSSVTDMSLMFSN